MNSWPEMISPDVGQLRDDVVAICAAFARSVRRALDNASQRVDRAQRSLMSPQDRLDRERERLAQSSTILRHALVTRIDRAKFETTLLRQRLAAQRPNVTLRLEALQQRRSTLTRATQNDLVGRAASIQKFAQALQLLAPERVLERGYSIVEHEGAILRDSANVQPGDRLAVRLARGRLNAEVKSVDGGVKLASTER